MYIRTALAPLAAPMPDLLLLLRLIFYFQCGSSLLLSPALQWRALFYRTVGCLDWFVSGYNKIF